MQEYRLDDYLVTSVTNAAFARTLPVTWQIILNLCRCHMALRISIFLFNMLFINIGSLGQARILMNMTFSLNKINQCIDRLLKSLHPCNQEVEETSADYQIPPNRTQRMFLISKAYDKLYLGEEEGRSFIKKTFALFESYDRIAELNDVKNLFKKSLL